MVKVINTKESIQYKRGLGNLAAGFFFLLLSLAALVYVAVSPNMVWGTFTTFVAQTSYVTVAGTGIFYASYVADEVPVPTSVITISESLVYPASSVAWSTLLSPPLSDALCIQGSPIFTAFASPNKFCDANGKAVTPSELNISQALMFIAGILTLIATILSCIATTTVRPKTAQFKPRLSVAAAVLAAVAALFCFTLCIYYALWLYPSNLRKADGNGNAIPVVTRTTGGEVVLVPMVIPGFLGPGWGILFTATLTLLFSTCVLSLAASNLELNLDYLRLNMGQEDDDLGLI